MCLITEIQAVAFSTKESWTIFLLRKNELLLVIRSNQYWDTKKNISKKTRVIRNQEIFFIKFKF